MEEVGFNVMPETKVLTTQVGALDLLTFKFFFYFFVHEREKDATILFKIRQQWAACSELCSSAVIK